MLVSEVTDIDGAELEPSANLAFATENVAKESTTAAPLPAPSRYTALVSPLPMVTFAPLP